MQYVPTFITIMVVLIGLVDFLAGKPADDSLRTLITGFYITTDDGDWTALYRFPALTVGTALQSLFGNRLLSWRRLSRTALVTITLALALFFARLFIVLFGSVIGGQCDPSLFFKGIRDTTTVAMVFHYLDFVLLLYVWDIIFWFAAQRLLVSLGGDTGFRGLSPLNWITLIIFGLYFFWFFWRYNVNHINPFDPWYYYSAEVMAGFNCNTAKTFSLSGPNLYLVQPGLPAWTFLFACIFGLIIYIFKPFLRKPLLLIADRLSGSDKHVLIILGAALTGIGSVILAFTGKS